MRKKRPKRRKKYRMPVAFDARADFSSNPPDSSYQLHHKGETIVVINVLTEVTIEFAKKGEVKHFSNPARLLDDVAQTEREIQALTKKQLELSIREMQANFLQIKFWWLILIFTIVSSAFLGAWLQSFFK